VRVKERRGLALFLDRKKVGRRGLLTKGDAHQEGEEKERNVPFTDYA